MCLSERTQILTGYRQIQIIQNKPPRDNPGFSQVRQVAVAHKTDKVFCIRPHSTNLLSMWMGQPLQKLLKNLSTLHATAEGERYTLNPRASEIRCSSIEVD